MSTTDQSSEMVVADDPPMKLASTDVLKDDGKDGGNCAWYIGSFHMVCAAIGTGVLGLPGAMAALGWIAGCALLLGFAILVCFLTMLLSRTTVVKGRRNKTYYEAVHSTMGPKHAAAATFVQLAYLFTSNIAYIIAPAISLQMIEKSLLPAGDTAHRPWFWAIMIGIVQMLFSQVPSLEHGWIGSAIGAALSVFYSAIAVYLGIANWTSAGTIGGKSADPVDKVFTVFDAIGDIMFSYASSSLLLDIAATLREPVVKNTRKAIGTSNVMFFSLYAAVAISNYGALGNAAQGDVLTDYTSPSWLIVVANFAVVFHLLPAFQVYAQTFFATVETLRRLRNPNSKKMGWLKTALWRAAYVLTCTAIGAAFPFFSSICSLVGAIQFWPLVVFYPIFMWMRLRSPKKSVRILFHCINVLACVLSLCALSGSFYTLVQSVSTFSIGGSA